MSKKFEKPKTVQDYVDLILKIIGFMLVIAYVVLFIISAVRCQEPLVGDEAVYHRSMYLFSNAAEVNPWIRSISLSFFLLSASFIVRIVLKFISKFLKKGRAVLNLVASLIKYAAVIVLIFLILATFKVDTVTLLVSAGVVSLVIGLGAQSLISDVIAGLFIVFEEVFDIGDIIVVDGFRGTVKEIGIRTTQIVDWGGNVKVVNNSDIRSLVNMTSELSTALVTCDIEYGESIERVETVIKNNLQRMKEAIPDIIEGPYYIGVSELGASGVTLKFIAQCKETKRFQVERDMLRQIKIIFDENNVGIPFPQVTINQPKEFKEATKKEKAEAEAFVSEQKEASSDIPTEETEIK